MPGEPAPRALSHTLLRILDILEAQLPGIRQGRDPEALHTFRVATRQTRALTGLFNAELGPDRIEAFRQAFEALGAVSGPVRDLDVYLQRLTGYERLFPTVAPPIWGPLREALTRERRAGRRALLRHLRSPRFLDLLASWRVLLESLATDEPGPSIEQVASKRIRKQYRRLLLVGREALEAGDDDKRHEARITAKKLRYLLEAFGGLFDPALVLSLLKRLKGLQDVLGDHQDLAVQRERLIAFGGQIVARDPDAVPTLMAMGRLDARLERHQSKAEKGFAKRFARLDEAGFRKRVKRAFER